MPRPNSSRFEFEIPRKPPNVQPPEWLSRLGWRWLWALPAAFVLLTAARSFVLVGSGERAVIFNRFTGTQPGQLGEGLHWQIPWVQSPVLYDVRTQTYSMGGSGSEGSRAGQALEAVTADGLPVSLDLSVLFHADPDQVARLHREIGPAYVEKVVRPQVRSEARMVVARYPVIEVYGEGRTRIVEEVNRRLKDRFAASYIVLDEFLMRDVRFSQAFQDAIEKKQVAQQEVQRMAFVVEQADQERRRKIIEAEGEAESIRLKAAALSRNPQLVEYEYVKNLPPGVKTVVTDGRTLVNLGEALSPAAAAEAQGGQR